MTIWDLFDVVFRPDVVTAWATVGLLIVAGYTAWYARGTLVQMREDSERTSRPYVYARLVPSLALNTVWDLMIENCGSSAAYDLKFSISDEVFIAGSDQAHEFVRDGAERLSCSGLTLPPGARLRTYWYFSDEKDPSGYVRSTVQFEYSAVPGGEKIMDPAITLDPRDLGITPVPSEGPKGRAEKFEKDVVNCLRTIAVHLGEGNR
ncbi:hypothetical protein ACUH92_02630 [Dermabacteraceae bacterium CCM 9520]